MAAVPALRVEIITRDFNRMLEQLARIDPRIEFATIVKEVAARVIMGALQRTRAAKIDRIMASWNAREWITLDGKKYHIGPGTGDYGDAWRLPDPLWQEIVAFREGRLKKKLEARGLSKKSWYHFSKKLAATAVRAPAYVASANYDGRDHPENASVIEQGSTGYDYLLTVINSSPVVQYADGEYALLNAMVGQTRRFETLMARGAFRSVESRAKAYPGIFVRETLAA